MTIAEFQSHAMPANGLLHGFHRKLTSFTRERLLQQLQADWPVWNHQSINDDSTESESVDEITN